MKNRFYLILLFVFLSPNAYSQTFDSLSFGLGFSQPNCLHFDSSNSILYAGGLIYYLGDGTPVGMIARWNGVDWDSLQSGVNGTVKSIINHDGKVFVGGVFNFAGGMTAPGVATWDGNSWSYFGDFLSSTGTGRVYKLYSNNNELYIGGGFVLVNGNPAYGLVRYDGLNYHTYPMLTNDAVIGAIEIYNGELYVGGNFQAGGGKNDIAKWDGTGWVSVGGGLSGFNTVVNDMIVYKNELYVSGHFLTSYGDPGNLIAKWNGTTWSSLGMGLTGGNCFDMEIFDNELYVAGSISSAGGFPVSNIAKWDGNNWSSFASVNSVTNCLTSFGNDLYIGGVFSEVNGIPMNRITRYNLLTGFNEVNAVPGLNIFPNPAKHNLTVSVEQEKFNGPVHIQLMDLSGKTILEKSVKAESGNFTLDVTEFSDGMYTLIIFDDKFVESKKIVVNR